MPNSNIKLLKQQAKNKSITIYENVYIDKSKENDKFECLNRQPELTFTPIYKYRKCNIFATLS